MSERGIPEEWVEVTLVDGISSSGLISDGDWVETKDQDPNGDVRLIQLADIGDGTFRNKSQRFMVSENAVRMNCTFLQKGDVLVARMPDPLGRACIFPEISQKAVTVVDICLIRTGTNSAFLGALLKYWINGPSIRSKIAQNASGTTRKRITRKKLEVFDFPLPPFAEQKEIAAQLDSLLRQVECIKNRIDGIPGILKKFRQSVLAAAVSGKLTEEWRGSDSPSFWENKEFSSIGTLSRGKSKHRPRNDKRLFGMEYPFIQTGEIAKSSGIILSANKYYSEFGLTQSKLFPVGTLCITIAANIADTAILGIEACFPDSVVGFIPNEDVCIVKYIKFIIDVNKTKLESLAPATAQKNINLRLLNKLQFTLPPLDEQKEIVRQVDTLFAFADNIETRVKEAQFQVVNMTQSILAKAFNGDLTKKWRELNRELVTGENSAAALLERIKAEREKDSGQNKKVKKKGVKAVNKKEEIIPILQALKENQKPLSSQDLLRSAGYPSDSSTEQVESFFLDIREQLNIGNISCERIGDEDIFTVISE